MISINRLKNDEQFIRISGMVLLGSILAVVFVPFVVLKFIFPFIWLALVIPWIVFVGDEIYQMLKVKFADADNGMIRSFLLGRKPDGNYFKNQSNNVLTGMIYPAGFHIAFILMTLSISFGVILSVLIGVALFALHLKVRKMMCNELNSQVA